MDMELEMENLLFNQARVLARRLFASHFSNLNTSILDSLLNMITVDRCREVIDKINSNKVYPDNSKVEFFEHMQSYNSAAVFIKDFLQAVFILSSSPALTAEQRAELEDSVNDYLGWMYLYILYLVNDLNISDISESELKCVDISANYKDYYNMQNTEQRQANMKTGLALEHIFITRNQAKVIKSDTWHFDFVHRGNGKRYDVKCSKNSIYFLPTHRLAFQYDVVMFYKLSEDRYKIALVIDKALLSLLVVGYVNKCALIQLA